MLLVFNLVFNRGGREAINLRSRCTQHDGPPAYMPYGHTVGALYCGGTVGGRMGGKMGGRSDEIRGREGWGAPFATSDITTPISVE